MSRRIIVLSRGLFIALLLILTVAAHRFINAAPTGTTYHLTPNDSIQAALERAQPGDTLVLGAGTYTQDVVTVRDGLPGAPITITGPREAVLNGNSAGRLVEINHAYITLDGFTINGERGGSHTDKLIYVLNRRAGTPLLGLRISNMAIGNAGGECIRLRYLVQQAEIAGNSIGPCGLDDFPNGAWAGGGKNGEGLYIGTAPEQLGDGKNPDSRPDESNNNWVHHNWFNTQGNECVDIKEGASGNLVEHNDCTGQRDSESAGFDARGSGNTFRWNSSYGNLGAGVRLGGDTADDGQANEIYENVLFDNAVGGIKIMRDGQRLICGNSGAQGASTTGSFGDRYQAGAPCSGSPQAPAPTAPPAPQVPPTPAPTAPPPALEELPPTPEPTAPPPLEPAPPTPEPSAPNGGPIQLYPAERVEVQAELGAWAEPWALVQDGERMGGAYLRNAGPGGVRSSKHIVSYEIEKLNGGRRCRLELFGRGDGDDANSVRVRVDDGDWTIVHLPVDSWGWAEAERALRISDGRHRLQIGNREYGSAVDAWAISCS